MGILRWAERIWPPSGARAERGRMERGAAKWRGRGLGQRNINFLLVDNKEICIYVNMYLCMTMLTINIPKEKQQYIKQCALNENKTIKDYILEATEIKEKLKLEARRKELKQTIKENNEIVKALVDL